MADDSYSNTVQDDATFEPSTAKTGGSYDDENAEETPANLELVKKIQKRIKGDKEHHKNAFKRMRADMFMARTGRDDTYPATHYTANLAGRHVKAKTAALYAKNPKAVAKRRETLDFKIWDESPKSLQMAMQTITMATQMLAQVAPPPVDATGAPATDPMTGAPVAGPTPPISPEMEQAFMAAHALVADFQQGMERRTQIDKIGKTLEILFAQALREQKPLDFKTAMKQTVRRACTAGVAYVELGFQRKYGPRPGMTEKLADARARLDHMKALTERINDVENPIMPDDPEIAELQAAIEVLQSTPEIILREGLIIDFPPATKVIPDRLCKSLVGFVGARHVTIEYMFTADQVKEMFGKDVGSEYVGYQSNGQKSDETSSNTVPDDNESDSTVTKDKGSGLCCVWKHFDKVSGLVYFIADGYKCFLRDPAGPDVFVEDFWPLYALTFNAVEDEDSLFPPSDVFLMRDQQMDYNRSRQGMREHRKAARPRWAYANGSFEEEDIDQLKKVDAFEVIGLNIAPDMTLEKLLQPIPVPGVDPNLYETGQLFTDIQMVVGSSEAQFGGTAQATATESAIAANSSASSDSASVDDLDAFLTVIARSSGQILQKEMSPEQVMAIAGPGALWPPVTLEQIANELFLEVEAGSSGKPNQAIQVQNFQQLAPLIMQIPGIDPHWLAKEAITRLDDRIDLTQAIATGIPSIVAQNAMTQIAPSPGAQGAPADQGAQGGQGSAANGPAGPATQQPGSEPAFGSNQV